MESYQESPTQRKRDPQRERTRRLARLLLEDYSPQAEVWIDRWLANIWIDTDRTIAEIARIHEERNAGRLRSVGAEMARCWYGDHGGRRVCDLEGMRSATAVLQ